MKTLGQLGKFECHWPVLHTDEHLFCAEPTGGKIYCPYHMTRAFVQTTWQGGMKDLEHRRIRRWS